MVGLPSTRVIPGGWVAHHRPVANGTMTEPCVIKRITDGPPPYPIPDGWTNEVQVWPLPDEPLMCRVQELNRDGGGTPGEQPTTERQYLVTIPVIGAPAFRAGEQGDVVHAIGRQFRISQIMFGTLLWEIDFICTDNLTQQNPA